jgi:hypothetical protein
VVGRRRRGSANESRRIRTAIRIYERLGFRRVPERDWSPVPGVDLLAFAISFQP